MPIGPLDLPSDCTNMQNPKAALHTLDALCGVLQASSVCLRRSQVCCVAFQKTRRHPPTPTHCAACCQVNLLVLHEAFSPSTPRLLREAAALLSPQSVAMPVTQAEHVTPITAGSGSDQSAKAVFASILHLANTGRHAYTCTLSSGGPSCCQYS